MSIDRAAQLAEDVRSFYQYQASFCENLWAGKVTVEGVPDLADHLREMSNSVQARVLACSAIDGLSAMWKEIENPSGLRNGNTARFISFLLSLNTYPYLNRVGTPFLYHFLNKQGIERPFRDEVKRRCVDQEDEYTSHRVYNDPTIDELKMVYQQSIPNPPLPNNQTIADIDYTLFRFTYAGLIYKFYRTSYVHGFRGSPYVVHLARPGEGIGVRQFSGLTIQTKTPSGQIESNVRGFVDGVTPQLDVPIDILRDAITAGADVVYNLIIRERLIDIPYSSEEDIKITTRR